MTLCVAVTTGEGLVLAADSMTYVTDASSRKTYATATKLFEIPGLPIAVMTYGLGGLGRRSIGSLLEEWIEQRPQYDERVTVERIASDIVEWVFERHRAFRAEVRRAVDAIRTERLVAQHEDDGESVSAVVPDEPEFTDWTTGLVIGGYQLDSFFPWLYEYEEPSPQGPEKSRLRCTRPHEQREAADDGPVSGLNWWGNAEALRRLVNGFDPKLVASLGVDYAALSERAEELRWPVVHEGMPLQDAVDYARFLLDVGCGYDRFKAGEASVGGQVDVAIVHRRGVHWVQRKALTEAISKAHPTAP